MGEKLEVITEASRAAAALQPVRLQILTRLREAGSAASIAPAVGLPRQQVNYHLRELERAGLVEFVEERKKGNCVERLYRSVAESFVIAPSALGGVAAGPEKLDEQVSADYLVALGAKLIEDLSRARVTRGKTPTLAIETEISFRNEKARGEFAAELADAMAHLVRKYHDDEGSVRFRVMALAHPISQED